RDLTERLRLAEESRAARRAIEIADELKASLREREILLQEVHHRVKNNLQVISSLINMQRRKVADESARLALLECQTRVQAIALIPEQLYMYADYARVPFTSYAQGLVANLSEALGSPGRVRVDLQVEPVSLAVDKAIPCGLIMNELVTNAFKHAFPGDRMGVIRVQLRALDQPGFELTVADDGVGMADGAAASGALGMQLVLTLVAQLGGTLTRAAGPGTAHTVRFAPEAA
ncbi:MAG: sensor histidine kinase, partial [Vicinamibacterales bacterium]